MKKYVPALLPPALGLAAALIWQARLWPNPVLFVRADAGTICLLAGLAAGLLWAWRIRVGSRFAHSLAILNEERADAHRRFVRRLDHELKNPLTAIRAGLARLADPAEDPILTSVRAQVDRLARLSADLRKLADLETQPIEKEAVDLAQVLTEVAEAARERPEASARRLQLTLPQAPWPLPPVAGDRDLLFLALHNLVDNAFKYSRPGDTLEIRAFEDGATVVAEVADTGPGVSDEELPHLGEELYRGNAPRSIEGSGLGLALVRAIVAQHQGTLAIRSRLGRGTVVTIRLPAAH